MHDTQVQAVQQKCRADMDSVQRMQSLNDSTAKSSIWKRCVQLPAAQSLTGNTTCTSQTQSNAGRSNTSAKRQTPYSMLWTNTHEESAGQPTTADSWQHASTTSLPQMHGVYFMLVWTFRLETPDQANVGHAGEEKRMISDSSCSIAGQSTAWAGRHRFAQFKKFHSSPLTLRQDCQTQRKAHMPSAPAPGAALDWNRMCDWGIS